MIYTDRNEPVEIVYVYRQKSNEDPMVYVRLPDGHCWRVSVHRLHADGALEIEETADRVRREQYAAEAARLAQWRDKP